MILYSVRFSHQMIYFSFACSFFILKGEEKPMSRPESKSESRPASRPEGFVYLYYTCIFCLCEWNAYKFHMSFKESNEITINHWFNKLL